MSKTRFPSIATDEEYDHFRDDEARTHNISAARGVAESVRSTLGPTGLDKMLVSSEDTITVTNDGETILKEMDVTHPAAQTLVQVAQTQAAEVGDGTTTTALIASELLQVAEELLDRGIHPTIIVDGYQRALDRTLDSLDEQAEPVHSEPKVMHHVAESTLTGKVVSAHSGALASLILDATQAVTIEDTVDLEFLRTVPVPGAAASRSELCEGVALDVVPCHQGMPSELPDSNILLLQQDFTVVEPETAVATRFESPQDREGFIERETQWIEETLDHLEEIGVTAVLCNGRVSDEVGRQLASREILAIDHLDRTDVEFRFLKEVTGATPITDPGNATADQLGTGSISRNELVYVENAQTHGVTIVARGTIEPIASEVERSLRDSINVVGQIVADGRSLPGGGAVEVETAAQLREYAYSVDGRTQVAIEAFSDALEVVPRTLARNTGLDPIDVLVGLRSAHESGRMRAGVNTSTKGIDDMFDAGVIQPAYVAEQSIYNATKIAAIILKIDEVITAPRTSHEN